MAIQRTISGKRFEYVPYFKWAYIKRKVVKIPDSSREAGVRITLPCGTTIFRPNSYYSKQDIENL